MFVQVSNSQSQTVWHTNPQQWNWQQPQQWSHNAHQQQAWYGRQPAYQPSWQVPQQQPMQQCHYQRPPLPHQPSTLPPPYDYNQQQAQNWSSNQSFYSHLPENVNYKTANDRPHGLTLVVPRSSADDKREAEWERNDNKKNREPKPKENAPKQHALRIALSNDISESSSENKQPPVSKQMPSIQRESKSYSDLSDLDEEDNLQRVLEKARATVNHASNKPRGLTTVAPRSHEEDQEEIQSQRNDDKNTSVLNAKMSEQKERMLPTASSNNCSESPSQNTHPPVFQQIERGKEGCSVLIDLDEEESLYKDTDKAAIKENHKGKKRNGSKRTINDNEKHLRKQSSESSVVEENDPSTTAEGNACKEKETDKAAQTEKKRRTMWNIIKQVAAIILIVLDVIFDWVEHGEMSKDEEWRSGNPDSKSCSTRGDHIATLFLVVTIFGNLFAIFQIVNLGYQIYTEKKEGTGRKKLMDGRTEVVITRLMEEIPQLLLIIAFRSECSITCNSDKSYKDVKSAVSATFSICNSVWRHLTSLDGCTFESEDKKESSGCCKRCNLQDIMWKWFSCCCPCIACWCNFKIPLFPCGKVFINKECKFECINWGCESDFALCITRCYPSHLDPPQTQYFEFCPKRPDGLNLLTKIFKKPLSVVHIVTYSIYMINILCILETWLGLDILTDVLF